MSARRVDRATLAELLEVEESFVIELEEHEIIVCDQEGLFDAYAVERVRVSWGMQHGLGVNMAGLEVALDLLERWHSERRRVHQLLELVERLRQDE